MSTLIIATAIIQQTLSGAVPLAVAGCGELLAQRAGVINVGIEGLMLTGCIAGFAVASLTGSIWLAVLAAMLAAGVLAAIFAVVTIFARVDQIVTGMAINLIAVGASGTIWELLQARGLDRLAPGIGWEPFGPGVFHQHGLFWIALICLMLAGLLLRRTRAGIIIAAIGDAPDAAAANGIAVRRWRFGLVVNAGLFAGLAGAFLSVMRTHGFVPEMTGSQGFLVLALVIFGRWTAAGLGLGCLLFGAITAIQQHCQAAGWTSFIPYQVFTGLPYVVALIALCITYGRNVGPLTLNQPWPRQR